MKYARNMLLLGYFRRQALKLQMKTPFRQDWQIYVGYHNNPNKVLISKASRSGYQW